jgi:hypothetical protein
MPEPLSLCIEDLGAGEDSPRYLRCVALVGREPGLRLDEGGAVLWQSATDQGPLELWVSQDDRLILFRREGGPPVRVERQGREYEVPAEKPVVLLDGDLLEVAGRRLRLHVHGPAGSVEAPAPLPERGARSLAKVAAAALALGTVVGGPASTSADESPFPLEVRLAPPAKRPTPRPDAGVEKPPPKKVPPSRSAPKKPSEEGNAVSVGTPTVTPLEVRAQPPAPPPLPRPDAGAPPKKPEKNKKK